MTGRQKVNKRRQEPKRRAREMGSGVRELGRRVGPSLLLILIVVGLPYLSYQAYLFAITSPSFAITRIEVEGAENVPREVLLEQGQIAPGVNIFDVDEERVAAQLMAHPWVERAEVEAKLPGTLQVRMQEHVPVVVVVDQGSYLLVDATGVPFKRLEPSDPGAEILARLPLMSGLSREALEQDEASRARLIEAMQVWNLWHDKGLFDAAPIAELHLDEVLGLSLIVGAQGMEVRLGWDRWEERLDRFALVYKDLSERGVAVDYVLVDQEGAIDRVAVGPTITKDR